jgi:hypothetical protein
MRHYLFASIMVFASITSARAQPVDPSLPVPDTAAESSSVPDAVPAVVPNDTTASPPVVASDDDGDDSAKADNKKKNKKKKNKKGKLEISGYMQIFFKQRFNTNGDNSTEPSVFRVQRMRLELSGKVTKHVGYDVDIDPRAPLITGILRDAYISLSVIPHHKIRIGQQKTLFGYENTESSTRLYVVNRTALSDNISRGPTLRDIGIGLLGAVPINDHLQVEDMITVVNGSGMNVQADETHRKNIWGRLGVRYDNRDAGIIVRAGASVGWGDQKEKFDPSQPELPLPVFKFLRFGGDLEVEHEYFDLTAEYAMGTDTPVDGSEASDSSGYYVQLVGKAPRDVGPIVRYDVLDDFKRVTAGAFWGGPEKKLRTLVNYEIIKDETGKHDHKLYLWMQGRF